MRFLSIIIASVLFAIISTLSVSAADYNLAVGESCTVKVDQSNGAGYTYIGIESVTCTNPSVYVEKIGLSVKATVKAYFSGDATVTSTIRYKLYSGQSYQYRYHRFTVACRGNGGGTGGGNTGGGGTTPKLELTHTEITVAQGQWSADIKSYLTTTPDGTCKWTIDDESIAKTDRREFFRTKVVGERPGTTYLRAVSKDGATAVCKVIVTSRSYNEEEQFYGITDDEPKVKLNCYVSKDNPKTCKIYIKRPDYPYDDTPLYKVEKIPEYVAGYKVTAIEGIDNASQTIGVSSIKIPSFVTRIGYKAFAYAYNLREISIPATVKEIGYDAFRSCYDLEKAECNFNEDSGTGIFQDCKALKSVVIKSGKVPSGCFKNCDNLKFVTINPNVTIIGGAAFQNCESLFEIDIPGNVTRIDDSAFLSCTSLSKVNLSEGIQSIGWSSFRTCNIKEIVLPSTLKSIGIYAFSAEKGFSYTTITSNISQPFSISANVFNEATYQNAVLLVPASSKHLYETTPGWKNFQHIEGYGDSGSDDEVETLLYEGLNEDDSTCDWTFESFERDVDNDYNYAPSDKEIWKWTAYNGKHYLVGNAHEFTDPFSIHSLAFSPTVKVNKLRKFRISFDHATKYQEPGLFYIADVRLYYADPKGKEDDGLLCINDIPTHPTPGTWTFVNSGEIEMELDEGKTDVNSVRICLFYYGDSEDGANVWGVKNIKMFGIGPASAIDEVTVDSPEANYPTEVYNLSGIKVADSTDNLPAGIYIVRRGPSVKKIAIR